MIAIQDMLGIEFFSLQSLVGSARHHERVYLDQIECKRVDLPSRPSIINWVHLKAMGKGRRRPRYLSYHFLPLLYYLPLHDVFPRSLTTLQNPQLEGLDSEQIFIMWIFCNEKGAFSISKPIIPAHMQFSHSNNFFLHMNVCNQAEITAP